MDSAVTPLEEPYGRLEEAAAIPVAARWIGSWRFSLQRRAMSVRELECSYDRAAPGWAGTLDRLGVPAAYERLLCRVVGEELAAEKATPLRVLDCGVGTGALAKAFARVSPAPFSLDAVDLSAQMLERAGRNLRAAGVESSLRRADVRELPYADGVFDLVLTGHVLEHLGDPRRALHEMTRVLKPGGLLVACLTRRSPLGAWVQLRWRTHRVTPAQAEGWLRASGLEDARCVSLEDHGFFRRLSVACAGRKPAERLHAGNHEAAGPNERRGR